MPRYKRQTLPDTSRLGLVFEKESLDVDSVACGLDLLK